MARPKITDYPSMRGRRYKYLEWLRRRCARGVEEGNPLKTKPALWTALHHRFGKEDDISIGTFEKWVKEWLDSDFNRGNPVFFQVKGCYTPAELGESFFKKPLNHFFHTYQQHARTHSTVGSCILFIETKAYGMHELADAILSIKWLHPEAGIHTVSKTETGVLIFTEDSQKLKNFIEGRDVNE